MSCRRTVPYPPRVFRASFAIPVSPRKPPSSTSPLARSRQTRCFNAFLLAVVETSPTILQPAASAPSPPRLPSSRRGPPRSRIASRDRGIFVFVAAEMPAVRDASWPLFAIAQNSTVSHSKSRAGRKKAGWRGSPRDAVQRSLCGYMYIRRPGEPIVFCV
jgi:hypothetical protein